MSFNGSHNFDFDAIDDEFSMKGFDFDIAPDLLLEDADHLVVSHNDNMDLTSSPDCLTDFISHQSFLDFDLKPFDCSSELPFSSFPEHHGLPDDDVVSSSDDFADSFSTPSSALHMSSNSSDDNRSAVWSLDNEECMFQRNGVKRVNPSLTISGSIPGDRIEKSNMPSITISLMNNHGALRHRQQSGVMSGRIKKKDPFLPNLRVKGSPTSSPPYLEEDTFPSSSSSSSGGSLPKANQNSRIHSPGGRLREMHQRLGQLSTASNSNVSQHFNSSIATIHVRPNGLSRQESSNAINSHSQNTYFNNTTVSMENHTQPHPRGYSVVTNNALHSQHPCSTVTHFSSGSIIEEPSSMSQSSSSSIMPSKISHSNMNSLRGCTSIKLEYTDHSSDDFYTDSTASSSVLTNSRTPLVGTSQATASLLHSSLSNQSDLLPITEEELRVMSSEGYPIPTSYPLNKTEEKNLKKVRRKIKNKRSAQESRRKKKEYMERLEKHADAISQENMALRRRLEEMERRLEITEGRNRQLMSRLCKVSATVVATSVDASNGSESCSPIPNHNSNPIQYSRPYSPPSCSTSGSSGNSTKFYIMAFVLLFSVLFAGDPTLIMLRSSTGINSLMLGSSGPRGSGALFHYSHHRWHHRADMFCPAGVRGCHKSQRMSVSFSDGSLSIQALNNPLLYSNHGSINGGSIRHKMDIHDKSLRPHVPDTQIDSLTDFIRTPSVLLDVQQESSEDSGIDCSLTRFWQNIWSGDPSHRMDSSISSEQVNGMKNVTGTSNDNKNSDRSKKGKISYVALPQAFTLMQ